MADESVAPKRKPLQGTQIEDLTGERFGRLIVIGVSTERTKSNRIKWDILCDCGNAKSIQAINLKTGDTTSCGCAHKEQLIKRQTTHGKTESPKYATWCRMLNRCLNENGPDFHYYGGRGIQVCDAWRDFSVFLLDMGKRPGNEYSIDRINVNGNYEPVNCRWATQGEQVRNTRRNRFVDGKTVITDAARAAGLNVGTVFSRIDKLGWTIDAAISTPSRRKS